ncbi:CinA family protein [Sphingomonas quercus]|uniref:CinA family protein n=1 Tax=Sphingomonas quercus TaxID=2842451 RepID=A0ABS6BMW6_9SPHN|nr:CinA family protein [Sphingomonas quercus]MBU3078579.1 CinA family protein [Sphingomonas quercus]
MTETLSPALPEDIERLTERVLKTAHDAGLTLATAESCTGGLIASLLTDVEGASHVFERGFVVYSEEAKCELLGLAPGMIEQCGVVSRDVAIAMAEGAIAGSHADVALSVTGFAGPGAEGDEPGLVHFACARRGGETLHREAHFGDIGRGAVRLACMRTGLDMMLRAMA